MPLNQDHHPPAQILVVDPDEDARLLFTQKFRDAIQRGDYAFLFAHQGSQALDDLRTHPIDLILTDINIPGLSGLELMRYAREDEIRRKVILVTSYGDTDNIRLAMSHGACDFCTKPIDFEDLGRAIDRALQTLEHERAAQKTQDDLKGIRQELAVSSRLQQSILPKTFPHHTSVELYAQMTAARDIGGDFYDFFWLDSTRLGFAIADVSGKNISAALYMAITRTLLKSMAHLSPDPEVCLSKVNQALCQDNESCMFATAFYGVLDIQTGHVAYANAGHCAPLWLRHHGGLELLGEGEQGLALGLAEDSALVAHSVTLQPGERLLLFTDGVIEAFSPDQEEYGLSRTLETTGRYASGSVTEWVQALVQDVQGFMGEGALPSDDLTVLALHFKAPWRAPEEGYTR